MKNDLTRGSMNDARGSAPRRTALALCGGALLAGTAGAQFALPENEVGLVCVEGQEPYALCYRDWASGSIDTAVDTDIFVFFGRLGDSVHLSVRSPNGMDPFVQILAPGGAPLTGTLNANDPPFSCGHICTIDEDFVLPASGVFTILVSDAGLDEAGSYTLSLERRTPDVPVPAVDYGVTEAIVLEHAVDHDFVSFEGKAGTLVTFALNSPNGLDPALRIWNPDGTVFQSASCGHICSISLPNLVLPQTGTYLLEVWDAGHDETGTVTFSLTCLLANCPAPREDVPLGMTYCTSNTNSTGNVATLSARGSTDPADNYFSLEVQSAPAGKLGIFFFGTVETAAPFGRGIKCIANPVRRLPPLRLNCSNGDARFSPDLMNLPGNTVFLPGETWLFQYWYRDKNPSPSTNLSNGLKVTF